MRSYKEPRIKLYYNELFDYGTIGVKKTDPVKFVKFRFRCANLQSSGILSLALIFTWF